MSNSTTPKFSFNTNELGENDGLYDYVSFIHLMMEIADSETMLTGIAGYNRMKPKELIDKKYINDEKFKYELMLEEIPDRYWTEDGRQTIYNSLCNEFLDLAGKGINKIVFVGDKDKAFGTTTFDDEALIFAFNYFDCWELRTAKIIECEYEYEYQYYGIKKGSNIKVMFF